MLEYFRCRYFMYTDPDETIVFSNFLQSLSKLWYCEWNSARRMDDGARLSFWGQGGNVGQWKFQFNKPLERINCLHFRYPQKPHPVRCWGSVCHLIIATRTSALPERRIMGGYEYLKNEDEWGQDYESCEENTISEEEKEED